MASTKISALTAGTPSVATDVVPIARGGANFSLTLANVWTLPTASQINWSDTGLSRGAAGTVKVTDGSSGAGRLWILDGTAALPSLYFNNNSTTGLYSTTGLVGITVAATAIGKFDTNGLELGSSFDAGISRSAASVIRTSNGSTGLGYAISGQAITTNTSGPVTINITDSGQLYTNTGAGGAITYNLPNDPTIGSYYRFAVMAAQAMDVTPASGESIRDAATTGSTKITANTIGNVLELVAITGGSGAVWLVLSKTGAWTLS